MSIRWLAGAVCVGLVSNAACGTAERRLVGEAQEGAEAGGKTVPGSVGPAAAALSDVRLGLTRVADLTEPLAMAQRPGDEAFYVAEKGGRVRVVRDGVVGRSALDISGEVSTGGEQGLLGITFSPDGSRFYASFTDTGGDSRLWEYPVTDAAIDPAGRREVLSVAQPFANHNGGQVTFGPDGLLYYFLGDGGSAGDPLGNGQNLSTLLGKALRVDPAPSGGKPYTVPPDNPFVGRPDARGEICSG